MKRINKMIQIMLMFSLVFIGLLANAKTADAKVVATGYTQLSFPSDWGYNKGIRRHGYIWSQERVGKTTYHTLFLKSPYRDDQRQATAVFLFRIDSNGVQKQVYSYFTRLDGDKPVALRIRTTTNSPGTYFYHIRSQSIYHEDVQRPAHTETMHVVVDLTNVGPELRNNA